MQYILNLYFFLHMLYSLDNITENESSQQTGKRLFSVLNGLYTWDTSDIAEFIS